MFYLRRLWGTINYFFCSVCNFYFPARLLETCKFHPEPFPGKTVDSISTIGEIKSQAYHKYFHKKLLEANKNTHEARPQEEEPQSIRKLACCKQPNYRFNPLPHAQVFIKVVAMDTENTLCSFWNIA